MDIYNSTDDSPTILSSEREPALLTKFRRKDELFGPYAAHHIEQSGAVTPLERELNMRGLIHYPDFLITDDEEVANQMIDRYDFTHSGFISVDPKEGSLILGMPKKSTGSLITSTKAFLYGRAAVTMKTSRGTGVITAIVFMSATQDEIDFEFLGGELETVQTNYYYQGELVHSRMLKHPIPSDSFQEFHIYEVDWNSERINWLVNGNIVRTLWKKDTWDPVQNIYKYPQTPMLLQVSLWPAGTPDSPPGTVQWAGGYIDWENAPDIKEKGQLYATIHRISVTPYENKFWPAIQETVRSVITQSEEERIRVTYGYEPIDGRYDERSLRWYVDAIAHLATWRSTGINPGVHINTLNSKKSIAAESYVQDTTLDEPIPFN